MFRGKEALPARKKPPRISFGRSEVLDSTSGEAQVVIFIDGDDVGSILKEVRDASGSMGWYPQWVAAGYHVEFVIEPAPADRWFPVEDFGVGTTTRERRTRARRALAAAKAYAAHGDYRPHQGNGSGPSS